MGIEFDVLLQALTAVFSLTNILLISGSLVIGLIIGAIPGLSVTLGVILFIPITYNMAPATAIISLLGVYVGGMYGGAISAILLNAPGTNAALATTFDGYPLAQKGQARKALDTALYSSVFGGFISAIMLLFLTQIISYLVSGFTSTEYFALAVLGMSLIAGISADNMAKGLLAAVAGLLISMIGLDAITGVARFTFNTETLHYGIGIMPVMIALVALKQVIFQSAEYINTKGKSDQMLEIDNEGLTAEEAKSLVPVCIRSSILGSFIGTVPGVGSEVAQFLCYSEAKRTSKHPEMFGKGTIEGVAAAEASNNAVVGSAMIPLLTMGIPGDGVTALLLGAFILHGIQPGPNLFTKQPVAIYTIMFGLMIANIALILTGLLFTKPAAKIVQVKYSYLAPGIIMFCFAGAFAATGHIKELILVAVFLVLTYVLHLLDIPTIPLMLGVILGDIMETNFVTSMMSYDFDILIFFKRPITLVILIIAVILVISVRRVNKRIETMATDNLNKDE